MIILLTGARQQATQVLSEPAALCKMNICTIVAKDKAKSTKKSAPILCTRASRMDLWVLMGVYMVVRLNV